RRGELLHEALERAVVQRPLRGSVRDELVVEPGQDGVALVILTGRRGRGGGRGRGHGASLYSIAMSVSSPSSTRSASSKVGGAIIMCCVATCTSRKRRWSRL